MMRRRREPTVTLLHCVRLVGSDGRMGSLLGSTAVLAARKRNHSQGELGFESYSCTNSKELNTPSSIVIAVPGKAFGCMAAFSRESCLQVLDRPLQAFNSSVYASSGVTVKLRFQQNPLFLI